MKEEKNEDVVERLAREFLNGIGEEEKRSGESVGGDQELKDKLEEEPSLPTFEMSEPEKEPSLPTFEVELPEEAPYPSSFKEQSPEEPYSPSFEIPEPKEPSLPTFEIPEPEEEPSPQAPSPEPRAPSYSPIYEEEKGIKPERPTDEKIEEILAKLEEEEEGINLPKEPIKVEEEEPEEFIEMEEVSDEEILVKRPKRKKASPKFIKFAILGCIFGGIIGGGAYFASKFGKTYYKPLTNLINLNIINNTINKIFKPSCDLMVSSNPSGCDLFVDDIVKGKTPITIKKLIAGDHNIRIEKKGFKPFISVVSVVSRKPMNITANLEPERTGIKPEGIIPIGTSTLIVRTNPKNAAIYIDGKRTKMPYTLLSGTHSIGVFNDGFFKWTKIIEIKPEETKEIFVQLTPCFGSILIDSTPRGGYILFNGDIKGKTPIILSGISPWKPFRITIKSKGYFDWNGTTFVEPNQRTKIMASLKESGGRDLESGGRDLESKEERFIPRELSKEEKRFVPKTQERRFIPAVPPRKEERIEETSASILALKRAIDMFKEQIKVEVPVIPLHPEEPFLKRELPDISKEKPRPQITGGTGYCFITSVPAGADVFLNGRLIGKTPIREFTISSGKHRLKACLSGFKEEEKEIVVNGETTNFFNFSLSK